VLPDGISEREAQSVHVFYKRVFQPKLNDDYNSFVVIQAEHIKEQIDTCEQNQNGYFKTHIKKWEQNRCRYEGLKKQIENCEQSGDEKEAVINKIWEAGKEYLMADI
jgi:predicted nucleotide-binding protein (sugar kinase/HSP70/actin superfamily)